MSNTNDTNTNTNSNKDNGEKGFFSKHGWKLVTGVTALGLVAGGAYYYMKNGGAGTTSTDAGDVASGIAKLFK